MKTLKNYAKFSKEYRLNENILKDSWAKISKFFKKKYKDLGWLYYALYLKDNDELPSDKVEIILPKNLNLDDIPSSDKFAGYLRKYKMKESESSDGMEFNVVPMNEEVITLDHSDPNVLNMNAKELVTKINRVFQMNLDRFEKGEKRTKNHSVFIWGAPGIGKTEILRQIADANGAVVIEWHLSQIEPTDFRGIPKIENIKGSKDSNDERTVTKLPAIFPDSDTLVPGIMFFDEMNRAPQMVLSASLSLCLSGTLGSYTLPEKWIVIAAGNRPEDLGDAEPTTIEPALANRFSHVNFSPTLEQWIEWALRTEPINPDIINFLKFKPQYFHKLDPENEPKAWPSPRSWELASEEEYHERGKKWTNNISSDELTKIYTSTVGAETATAFDAYLELKKFYNEKDVEAVYKIGPKAKKLPKRADQAFAASGSIASYKKGQKLTTKELTNLLDFVLSLPDIETRTPILSQFKDFHPEVKTDEPWKTIWWDYIKKWYKELKDME